MRATPQTGIAQYSIRKFDSKSRGYFFLWSTFLAFLLGLMAFTFSEAWLFPMFFVCAYVVILFALIRSIALWRKERRSPA